MKQLLLGMSVAAICAFVLVAIVFGVPWVIDLIMAGGAGPGGGS